jgi:hypothetical protein
MRWWGQEVSLNGEINSLVPDERPLEIEVFPWN